MKQKFSNSQELHEFIFGELLSIVGVGGNVTTKGSILDYYVIPDGVEKCLWQPTLRKLLEFFTKNGLRYYINFELGYLRAYTDESKQKEIGRL